MHQERRTALVKELIEYRRSPQDAIAELAEFDWDAESPLATIGVTDLRRILGAFLTSELSAEEVVAWADAVEVRDDVGFESGAVRETVHVLANPDLEGRLDSVKADALRAALVAEKYPCACCGYLTMAVPPGEGSYDICPVCFWEDDGVQWRDPDYPGGANAPSLREARRYFEGCGANHPAEVASVRPPRPDEEPRHRW